MAGLYGPLRLVGERAPTHRHATLAPRPVLGVDEKELGTENLEALGTGATGKEAALYERLRRELGQNDDPTAWPNTFTWIAWRLHVPAAVDDLSARAHST